jgi:deoxyribonuclease IV
MQNLIFGTAGIPTSTEERSTLNGIKQIKKLNLGAMEMEFVQSVNISEEKAPEVKKAAQENDVILTCHGQYFINLNAVEKAKIEASKQRIFKAAKIADLCGAFSMTFHPAFYLGQEKNLVYEKVKVQLKDVVKQVQNAGHKIWVRPETTGKGAQFGDIDELLKLSTEIEQVMPCIDFAHLHARSGGKYNTPAEFKEILEKVEKMLGKEGLQNMHIHMSGIAYSEKGEKNHLILEESDFKYKDLLKVWKEFKIKGVVINESPNIEEDALLMKKTFEEI